MRDPLWLLFVFSLQVNSSPKPVSYTRFEGFPYVQKPPVIADQLFGAKLQHKLPTHWSSPKHCNQSQGLKTGDTRQKPERSECRVRPGLKNDFLGNNILTLVNQLAEQNSMSVSGNNVPITVQLWGHHFKFEDCERNQRIETHHGHIRQQKYYAYDGKWWQLHF